jgi:2-oxoglutarate ferredoxin oxidoreductase subunit beta
VAIAAEATFIARTVDTDPRHMGQVLTRAAQHKGVSFVEIYQNCIIFNKDVHVPITGRENREDRAVYLEDGKPLIFGKNKDKAIALNGFKTETVDLAGNPDRSSLLTHHESDPSPNYAYLLTQMNYPEMPVPFGIFRCIEKPTYDEMLNEQVRHSIEKKGRGTLEKILYTEDVWTVEGKGQKVGGATK